MSDLAPTPFADRILIVRGLRVMLDADLAELYGVPTKRFNEQVKRNLARFPVEFMFQLTAEEFRSLRSQIATASPGRGGRRHAPYAFTEHGAIMAATLLNSPKAVDVGAGLPAMRRGHSRASPLLHARFPPTTRRWPASSTPSAN